MDEEFQSLADFADAEVVDEPADVVDETAEPEVDALPDESADAGGLAPDEEPAGAPEHPVDAPEPEPAVPDAPDAPADEAAPETPEPDELVVESAKTGWPKPDFDPNALEGEALKVQQHWRRVFSVSRQEVAAQRKAFDGIVPEEAKQHKAVYDDLMHNEKYAGLRVHAGMENHPVSEDAAAFTRALDDARHPDHIVALQMYQRMRAGGQAPTPPPQLESPAAATKSLIQQATDEYGEIDEAKFASLMQERDRQIASRVAQRVQQNTQAQASAAPNPPPAQGAPDVVDQFADFQGLDASEIRPLLIRERFKLLGEGLPEPPGTLAGIKTLWDRVQAGRSAELRTQRQAEVARHRGASTSRPRSTVPDGGDPATGLSLWEHSQQEHQSNT